MMTPLTPERSRQRDPRRQPRVARKMGQLRVIHFWHGLCLAPLRSQQARQICYDAVSIPKSSIPGLTLR